ncbi:MAG: M3 family oligoendopeptidase [Thermoanaerobaculia bacterium]
MQSTTTYLPGRWDLSDLLPDDTPTTVDARLAALRQEVEAFEAVRRELDRELSPGRFLELLGAYERLVEGMVGLSAYASLRFAEDTQSTRALALKGRIDHALTGLQTRVLFFSLWWKGLDDTEAARLLPAADTAPDARHFLSDLRRLRPFTLDERSEQLINTKDANGIDAVLTLYSMLTNRLQFSFEIDGRAEALTRDELMSHVHSRDPERRAAAYRELYRVFGAEQTVLGQIYVNRVRDWYAENVELRGFSGPLAVRNVANDLPDRAVDALLEVTIEKAPLFQRFFRWKARRLGLPRLRRYDLYAPVGAAEESVEYEKATDLVLSTFGRFDARIAALAERVFSESHVDAETRPGKKGGAFCATVLPRQTPWVLLNYTGRVRDVATMAHELGHAVHSLLAADHSVLTQHASLPLAETASVFAEMLLTERLLSEVESPAAKRELLAGKLDDIYATVMRQAGFTRFEVDAHRAILEGRRADELNELYLGQLREQLGDAVEIADEFAWEWVSIPHIFQTPFYCYSYSFGQLLVLALYRRYQHEGEGFVPGYLRLLAHGGAAPPLEVLAEVGVDPADRSFWEGGFRVVEDLVTELEALDTEP